eukprot:2474040-Pleurochrysis_carterae.AAC.3
MGCARASTQQCQIEPTSKRSRAFSPSWHFDSWWNWAWKLFWQLNAGRKVCRRPLLRHQTCSPEEMLEARACRSSVPMAKSSSGRPTIKFSRQTHIKSSKLTAISAN